VPKLIVDAFSVRMIVKDDSESREIKMYHNDDLRWVRAIEIEGDFTQEEDKTEVWIFGKVKVPWYCTDYSIC